MKLKVKILKSFDKIVLENDKVEKWFALLYSFVLGRYSKIKSTDGEKISEDFRTQIFDGVKQDNQLNATKYSHYFSWFEYIGFGFLQTKEFVINPYGRVKRYLVEIFDNNRKISMDDFIKLLSKKCPELDGGLIFLKANKEWKHGDRKLSLGLMRALYELHEEKIIRLGTPQDARDFWSFEDIMPTIGKDFTSVQVSTIEILGKFNAFTPKVWRTLLGSIFY